jgi:hypothetical protein
MMTNDGNFLKRFLDRMRGGKSGRKSGHPDSPDQGPLARLMTMIDHTEEVEISCDDVFELLDQFSEMSLRGEDVDRLMPMVKHHLEMCAGCREEYDALVQILENQPSANG